MTDINKISTAIASLNQNDLFRVKYFFNFNGEEFSSDFEKLKEKKWVNGLRDQIFYAFFKNLLKWFMVVTLSIIVEVVLATWVSLFINAATPYSNHYDNPD